MARERPDVIYVYQGVPRIYEIVNAILGAGYSCRLLTAYYFKENGWIEKLACAVAPGVASTLKRRHLAKLPPEIVERSWMQEFLMALERLLDGIFPNFVAIRNTYIDLRAALRIWMLRPRVVITGDTHALLTLRMAKRIGAVAILDQVIGHVAAANELLGEEQRLRPEIDSSFRPSPAYVVRRCIKEVQEADYVFVPSSYVRDTLLPFSTKDDRILLLPYGADVSVFAPSKSKPDKPFRILFAGHIGLRKGVYYLLEAVQQAGLRDVEVILLGKIEGSGEWLDKYRGLFTHINHLPHQETPSVFASAHIYVYPSLHEGSTVSIYEAMASGLPIVATPNAGSVVRDGEDGFIVPIRDIDALSDRIERLYHDADLRRKFADNAATYAAEYSWEAYSRRIGKALNGILERNSP